jgi:hypothetical protein
MSFATSQPLVNRFFGGAAADVATVLRTHLLANVPNRAAARFPTVAQTVRASIRMHPTRVAKIMRRVQVLTLDLVN